MRQTSSRVILMRQSLAVIMLVSLVVVYVIWTTNDNIVTNVVAESASTAPVVSIFYEDTSTCSESLDDRRPWLTATQADYFTDPPSAQTSTSTTTPPTPTTATATNPTPSPTFATSTPKNEHDFGSSSGSSRSTANTTIYFVTPTHPRREQIAELTRLGQTLMHVPRLHWIVADDAHVCSAPVERVLRRFGIPFTLIASPMPDVYRAMPAPQPRGVANRRAAISWLRENGRRPGVLYFGDDDNSYDLRLFGELRQTRKVSMFPVGLIGKYALSAPVVKEGKVIGFYDSWPSDRRWPVDMAGFAVSLDYLFLHPNATMPYNAGYEETEFLQDIHLRLEDIEPRASNCTEVLVWHTQTKTETPSVVHISAKAARVAHTSSLGRLLRAWRRWASPCRRPKRERWRGCRSMAGRRRWSRHSP